MSLSKSEDFTDSPTVFSDMAQAYQFAWSVVLVVGGSHGTLMSRHRQLIVESNCQPFRAGPC